MKKREALLNKFEDELGNISTQEAKATYFIILKLSFRLYNMVDRLRVDNPMLNRPFIYNGLNIQT